MDKPRVTPKDFFLWAGAMIALYWSVFAFVSLLFSYIDYTFPDSLNSYVDPYSSAMRFSIASLVVLFPLFVFLMRLIHNDIAQVPAKKDLWVRRWLIVLTIFVAGFSLAADLITVINYFLGGDLTTRFILKVAAVLLIAAGVLMHFLAELWGYWDIHRNYSRQVGYGTGVLILVAIVAGFFIMGTPGQVRLYRFDDQKVNDLQTIQYQIVNYWQTTQKLPTTLADLNDPLSGFTVPVDAQSGAQYTYATTGAMSFKLCATFNAETQPNSVAARAMPVTPPMGATGTDLTVLPWTHSAGEVCFDRSIDPQRYPPFNKK